MATIFTNDQITVLDKALNPATTANQSSAPIVNTSNQNAKSTNSDENPSVNSPSNTPIYASGNANNAATAIKKSNELVSKACGTDSYVGLAVNEIGKTAGALMRQIRDAIKAALKALGVNPGSSAIVSQIKKFAQWLKDQTKWIKEITDYLNKFIAYTNAIKQLLSFLLSLPSRLLQYFQECIALLKKQLVSGFKEALGNMGDVSDPQIESLQKDFEQIKSDITTFTNSVTTLAATATTAALSTVDPAQFNTANTQYQAEATSAVFSAAGFSNESNKYGGKP